jgi:uncharacterized protein (DUF2267 family)
VSAHGNPFAAAEHNAHIWLATVAQELGTEDRRRAERVLRTWLHLVRDQLPVNSAAHFGAQLPEFLRGVYYEDWSPGHSPGRCPVNESIDDFANAANLREDEALPAMAAVTSALRERCSPGQLDHALVQVHQPLRSALRGDRLPSSITPPAMRR